MTTQPTRVTRHIQAPPAVVYSAQVLAEAIARWRFPDGMSVGVDPSDNEIGWRRAFERLATWAEAHA